MDEETKAKLAAHKAAGAKIVVTNGCFDILHVGHIRYLKESKRLGDILVVGINSDSSVKKLKGAGRPLNKQSDRAEVLEELKSVDYVVVFDEADACNLLRELRPDYYTKGGDYSSNGLNRPVAKATGRPAKGKPGAKRKALGADSVSFRKIPNKWPEAQTAKELGTKIVTFNFIEGYSSSKIINQL
jgi:rfaE bifunctional protein nucleotidyltransferase chain/domain